MHRSFTAGLQTVVLLTAGASLLRTELPDGWSLGAEPGTYDSTIDTSATYKGEPSTCLKSNKGTSSAHGFGTVQRSINGDLDLYRGKRIRFSANVKAEEVEGWAGLWMRVDGARNPSTGHPAPLSFDNMQSRPIKGSKEWQSYTIVLDVPEEAAGIYQGLLLAGAGTVWLNGVKVEVVGKEVPTTSGPSTQRKLPDAPTNLNFEK